MISVDDIRRTYETIRHFVRRTPVLDVGGNSLTGPVSNVPEVRLVLKLEHLQCSGSFKARGAFANLLLRKVPSGGVVAASGGNHGVAVAYAALNLGIPAKIFVPTVCGTAKLERIRELGASVVITGDRYADAAAAAEGWELSSGALNVHAFDQCETLLGQGSIGLELAEQDEQVNTVLVPVGGGGLIAGIAAYFAGRTRIVGVEPTGAPTLTYARALGQPTDAPTGSIAADALAPRRVGDLGFEISQAYVESVLLVDDDAILESQRVLWEGFRLLVEPAGAVALAALLTGAYVPAPREHVAVVLSGANTSLPERDVSMKGASPLNSRTATATAAVAELSAPNDLGPEFTP